MIDAQAVPDVEPDELLARYVLQSSHLRADGTVKQDAFSPHPRTDLSVTRHLLATVTEIWDIGLSVAAERGKTLYGRADIRASVALAQELSVIAKPIEGNPNHADSSGWPADKPAQKIIAQELAAAATFEGMPGESR